MFLLRLLLFEIFLVCLLIMSKDHCVSFILETHDRLMNKTEFIYIIWIKSKTERKKGKYHSPIYN